LAQSKFALSCGAALGALVVVAPQSVLAQDAAATAGPATTIAAPDEAAAIVVTGLRSSIDASARAKRNAPTVLEAITPEDLGKFTDMSIADELVRVPGVQIDHDNDGRSGDHVTILGLGSEFVTTSVNGRTPSGYGSEGIRDLREFAVDILPSEILSGVSVYKSTSAEMIESGLGGSVDFQTLRPLDYHIPGGRTFFGNMTVKATNNDSTSQWGKGISGVVGGKLFEGRLGIVVSGEVSDNPNHVDFMENRPNLDTVNVRNASGGVSQQSVIFPGLFDYGVQRSNQKRRAFNVALQYQPSDNIDINVDYTYSYYDRPDNRNYDQIGPFDAGNILQGVFEPGGITIVNGGVTALDFSKFTPAAGASTTAPFGVQTVPLIYNNTATIQIGGINAKFHNDRLVVAVDLSLNKLRALQDLGLGIGSEDFYSSLGELNYSGNTSGPATLNAGAEQFNTAGTGNLADGTYQRYYKTASQGGSAKIDLAYTANPALTIKAGLRYYLTDVDVRDLSQGASPTASQLAQGAALLFPGGTTTVFPGQAIGRNTQLTEDPQALFSATNGFMPQLNLNGPLATGAFFNANSTEDGWALNPQDSHTNREQTLAGYVQADVTGTVLGMDFSGNAGVRLVETWEEAKAFQSITYIDPDTSVITHIAAYVPVEQTNRYFNALPAMNLTLHPERAVNLRLAISKSLSRPEFEMMAPTNVLNVPDPTTPGYTTSSRGSGAIGNVGLKPETAWNFLASAEYYGRTGATFAVSAFYKDVKNFIAPVTAYNTTVPGQGGQLFNVTTAENISGGYVYGAEVSVNQPLRPLARVLDGFGVQANYVYVDSSISEPISGYKFSFPGASKNTIAASLYYSKGPLDARVAVTHRSNYLSQLPVLGLVNFPVFTDAMTNVDANVTYAVTKTFSITFAVNNLTRQNRRDYVYNTTTFLDFYQVPRTFSIALRARL
jgi:iron complex outermembrane recepter protein